MRLDEFLSAMDELYQEVDRLTDRLHQVHSGRLRCRRGCSRCCVDGITVYEVEAESIRYHCPDLLQNGDPHPEGGCAFLDEEQGCRIYEHRPYVCRTQGLPLRWIEEREDGEFVEMRDICPLNDEGEPVENLPEEECWTIGPFEERLAELQFQAGDGEMRRIALSRLSLRNGADSDGRP